MQTLRHHIVSPLLSLLLIAGSAAPSLHTISHFLQEPYSPHETEQAHDTPVFEGKGCVLCVLAATLGGIELEALVASPAYAALQHSTSGLHLGYAFLAASTDARGPPATA